MEYTQATTETVQVPGAGKVEDYDEDAMATSFEDMGFPPPAAQPEMQPEKRNQRPTILPMVWTF